MAHGVGQLIQSSDFSEIYQRFYQVFGSGSGSTGYGQSYTPTSVSPGNLISSINWIDFRNNMIKARQHQIGRLITSSNSLTGYDLLPITNTTLISEEIRNQYNNFCQIIENDKYSVHASQLSEQVLVDRTRQTSWNNRLTHTIKVSSSQLSYNNFRYFFNAGGRLEFNFNRSGGPNTHKNAFWGEFLSKIGTIRFNYDTTSIVSSSVVSPIVSNIGFYELNATEQQIYKSSGTGSYVDNFLQITAKVNSTYDTITFTITFADDLNEYPIDQNISGYLTSKLTAFVPSGRNVNVSTLVATDAGLLDGIYQTKYVSNINASVVTEGAVSYITIACNNPSIRQLYWTTSGSVDYLDFDDSLMSGVLPLSEDGVGTLVRSIREDKMTELGENEFYSINFSETLNGPMICNSGTIYIEDTSVYELTVDKTSVDEGDTLTYTINSTSAANGKTLYVTFYGIQASDIVNGFMTRPLTIVNGTASGTIRIVEDRLDLGTGDCDRGVEKIIVEARQDSPTGEVVARSPEVTINDTSPTLNLTLALYNILNRTQTLTSSGSWMAPRYLADNVVTATVFGAGGGGGGYHYPNCGAVTGHYGGHGGKGDKRTYAVSMVPTEWASFTVGAGGAGGSRGHDGATGQTSYFKNTAYQAVGGGGGHHGYGGHHGNDGTTISDGGVPGGNGGAHRDHDYNGKQGDNGRIELAWKEYNPSSNTQVTANMRVDYTINTSRIPNGTKLYIVLVGNISDSDIVGGRYSVLTVNNNVTVGSFTIANLYNSGNRRIIIQVRAVSHSGPLLTVSEEIPVVVHGSIYVNNNYTFTVPDGITQLNIRRATAAGYTDTPLNVIPGQVLSISRSDSALTLNGYFATPHINQYLFRFWGNVDHVDYFAVRLFSGQAQNYSSSGGAGTHAYVAAQHGVYLAEYGEGYHGDLGSTVEVHTLCDQIAPYASNLSIYLAEFSGRNSFSWAQFPAASNNFVGSWTVYDPSRSEGGYYYAIRVKMDTHLWINW